jgi:ABC-2 type transport system permease protein
MSILLYGLISYINLSNIEEIDMLQNDNTENYSIEVRNLTKKFGDFTAVDNISFSVKRGETFVFLGPNGAGKTTTIKMLTTLLRPTTGTMLVNGYDPIANIIDHGRIVAEGTPEGLKTILWLIQLKRYIRSRSRIIGSLGQPLLFLIAPGYGLGPIFQKAGQGNYLEFLAPVSWLNIMIGRTLGGATVAALQGIIVFFISLAAGFRHTNITLLPIAFLIMVLTALLFTAMGTALASLLEDMQGFQIVMNFLVMPIFFRSGALFPL